MEEGCEKASCKQEAQPWWPKLNTKPFTLYKVERIVCIEQ